MLYGSESWTLTKADEEKLRTFERRILRKIMALHVKMVSGEDELCSLYTDIDIVRVIKVARIRWLGHLVRMEENSPCKKITFFQPEGSR
jgi:hypothetical protein